MITRQAVRLGTLSRICNPTAPNMSIYNAKKEIYRIRNPYTHSGRIANLTEQHLQIRPSSAEQHLLMRLSSNHNFSFLISNFPFSEAHEVIIITNY